MADGDRVSAALWVDGGRCADARARDASRALFPRSYFHGFSLRACAGELCRVRRAVAPQPCSSFRLFVPPNGLFLFFRITHGLSDGTSGAHPRPPGHRRDVEGGVRSQSENSRSENSRGILR